MSGTLKLLKLITEKIIFKNESKDSLKEDFKQKRRMEVSGGPSKK